MLLLLLAVLLGDLREGDPNGVGSLSLLLLEADLVSETVLDDQLSGIERRECGVSDLIFECDSDNASGGRVLSHVIA